jgi:hypothetical protein
MIRFDGYGPLVSEDLLIRTAKLVQCQTKGVLRFRIVVIEPYRLFVGIRSFLILAESIARCPDVDVSIGPVGRSFAACRDARRASLWRPSEP